MFFGRFLIAAAFVFIVPSVFVRPSLAAQQPSLQKATVLYGSASIRIKVPRKPSAIRSSAFSARGLRPQYISTSTESFSIQANALRPVVLNVNPNTLYASIKLYLPAGTYSFKIVAYDKMGASGNVLSKGVTPSLSVPARGNASISVTLAGVVASVALSLGELHVTVGSPANLGLQVNTLDADGNYIVSFGNPQPLTEPITLTSSNPLAAPVVQPTLTQSGYPGGPFFTARIAYTGANVNAITFSAAGAGLRSVSSAVLVPLAAPASGQQIFATQYVDSMSSFSTLPGNQFLGTVGSPPQPNGGTTSTFYNEVAVDNVARRLYVSTSKQNFATGQEADEIDSFQIDSPRSFVDSIPLVSGEETVSGLAVDSAGGRLYASTYDAAYNPGISIYSTATGHALIGRIAIPRLSELAVDPVAARLYTVSENGLFVYQSVPPFAMLASIPTDSQYASVAADSSTGKVYFFTGQLPGDPYQAASFIDTYDGSNLSRRLTHTAIGTQFDGALAIDTLGKTLYVTSPEQFPENAPGEGPSLINAYSTNGGLTFIGSFPLRSIFSYGNGIAVAPYVL